MAPTAQRQSCQPDRQRQHRGGFRHKFKVVQGRPTRKARLAKRCMDTIIALLLASWIDLSGTSNPSFSTLINLRHPVEADELPEGAIFAHKIQEVAPMVYDSEEDLELYSGSSNISGPVVKGAVTFLLMDKGTVAILSIVESRVPVLPSIAGRSIGSGAAVVLVEWRIVRTFTAIARVPCASISHEALKGKQDDPWWGGKLLSCARRRCRVWIRQPVEGVYHGLLPLIALMIEQGYNREHQAHILRLLEWVMILPETLEQQVEQFVEEYKRKRKTSFVSRFEQRLIRQGVHASIMRILQRRFGEDAESLRPAIEAISSLETLEKLVDDALDAPTLEAFEEALSLHSKKADE